MKIRGLRCEDGCIKGQPYQDGKMLQKFVFNLTNQNKNINCSLKEENDLYLILNYKKNEELIIDKSQIGLLSKELEKQLEDKKQRFIFKNKNNILAKDVIILLHNFYYLICFIGLLTIINFFILLIILIKG